MNEAAIRAAARTAEGAVVAKATLRAAERLGLSAKILGSVIGLSEPTISRMKRGTFSLDRGTKPFELALLFVRLFRSLDAILGGDEAVARAWLRNENSTLGGKPIDSIQTISGLANAIVYLDTRRGVI